MKKLFNDERVVIYGAGLMGKALKKCLESSGNTAIICFLVQSSEGNPVEIDGIPVISIDNAKDFQREHILIALHEKHIDSALENLKEKGFINLTPISFDSDLWSELRERYLEKEWERNGRSYKRLSAELKEAVHLYVVHSVYDKALKEDIVYNSCELPIQAGKALTDRRLFDITDDIGDNISEKNRNYSELTALYWIWKHDRSKFAGISHYRRKFKIDDKQLEHLLQSDIDVVVTVPVINFNTVKGQYCLDHSEEDWQILSEAVDQLYPEYMTTFCDIEKGNWYYAYNMFIARKEILNEYGAWLFPILEYCDKRIRRKNDAYQDRYAGFLSERLMTVFLTHNEKRFNIAISDKHFFEEER